MAEEVGQLIQEDFYYKINSSVKEVCNFGRYRKDEVILNRLQFGHTGLNALLYKIGKHITGKCAFCGVIETVELVILKCRKYNIERIKMIKNLKGNNKEKRR